MKTFYTLSAGLLVLFFQATEAEWRPASGPWGCSIDCFTTGNGAVLAGSIDYGIFRSTDGGMSWTPADSGIPVAGGGWRPVHALAAQGNVFFSGTNSGVFRSTDNGASWIAANSGITGTGYVEAILVNDSGIFAGVGSRVYRSIDGGEHWTQTGEDFGRYGDVSCMIARGNSLFLVTGGQMWGTQPEHGVWLSTNNGETWTPVDSGLPNKSVNALAAGNGAVFASTDSGVFRSTDNGEIWTAADSGIAGTAIYDQHYPLLMRGNTLYAATDSGLFRSETQGESWIKITTGPSQFGIKSLATNNDTLFAGTISGGIFRSTDNGSNWDPVNSGLRSYETIRTLSVAGGLFLAGSSSPGWGSGIFTSADDGLHWNDIASGFTNDPEALDCYFFMIQGGAVFARTDYRYPIPPGYSLSTDGGASWTRIESGLTDQAHSFASLPVGFFIGTQKGVVRSIDSGKTWSGPDSSIAGNPIYSLTEKNGKIVGGSDGGVFVSPDSGKTWKKVSFGLMSMRVEALATCGDALFAGSSYNGVFRSVDNGETWQAVNSGLVNTSVFSLISHDSTLFAGTFGDGVFLSTDNGAGWRAFNDGLEDKCVYSLAVKGDELFAGTEGYGVWQRPLSETGIISDRRQRNDSSRQTKFALSARGAANSLLTITFSIPRPDHVAVTLFSLSGKVVVTIFDRPVGAGMHRIQWDCRAVARGCYAIKLQAGGESRAGIIRIDR